MAKAISDWNQVEKGNTYRLADSSKVNVKNRGKLVRVNKIYFSSTIPTWAECDCEGRCVEVKDATLFEIV